jgi:hypothetical protein
MMMMWTWWQMMKLVNSNLRGNEDKCKEMFGNIHFPELDEPVPPMDPVA